MRRLIALLLIALLPLQGWAGAFMAADGIDTPVTAVAQGHPDCADHATMVTTDPAGDRAQADADVGPSHACTACQVCHSPALAAHSLAALPEALPGAMPVPRLARFTSVVATPALKPPIS